MPGGRFLTLNLLSGMGGTAVSGGTLTSGAPWQGFRGTRSKACYLVVLLKRRGDKNALSRAKRPGRQC